MSDNCLSTVSFNIFLFLSISKFISPFFDYAEDVLEISDPTSGIFDDDIKGETINILKEQIEELEISISEREYELQGVLLGFSSFFATAPISF
jgi:hypothetical protein